MFSSPNNLGDQVKHNEMRRAHNTYEGKEIRGADKSLARSGRKQARKHVRDARDFNNIETRAAIKFFFLYA